MVIKKVTAALFRLESSLWRSFYRLTQSFPASDPFITGDGFRSLADGILDEVSHHDGKAIDFSENKIIFIRGETLWQIKEQIIFPKRPFVLITHNSDYGPDEDALAWWKKVAPLNSLWFAQNCRVKDTSVIPIPIGIENKRLHSHGVVSDFQQLRTKLGLKAIRKQPRVLYGFAIENNPRERIPALESLGKCPVAEPLVRVNSRAYRKILIGNMAVASPVGNGLDTHRTWEAFYLHTIPIVTATRLTEEWPDFPWMVVQTWGEVESLEGEALSRTFERISKDSWEDPRLFMPYWRTKILNAAKELPN